MLWKVIAFIMILFSSESINTALMQQSHQWPAAEWYLHLLQNVVCEEIVIVRRLLFPFTGLAGKSCLRMQVVSILRKGLSRCRCRYNRLEMGIHSSQLVQS